MKEIPKNWIEAAARAILNHEAGMPGDWWDSTNEAARNAYRDIATSCLAAIFGKATLVRTNEFDDCDVSYAEVDCDWSVTEGTQIDLKPGDTLVIVRGC